MSDYDGRELCEGRGNCLKYLKREVEQKRGEGKHRFKKGGQAGSRSGYLKKAEGDWNPLTNYEPPNGFEYGALGLGIQHLNH